MGLFDRSDFKIDFTKFKFDIINTITIRGCSQKSVDINNLGNKIKIVNKDNIVFENDDVLYFPKKQYQVVHDAWKNYNRFVN